MEYVEYEKTLTISTTTRERSRPFTAVVESKRDYLRRSVAPGRRVRSNTDVEEIKKTRRRNVANPNLEESTDFLTPYREQELSSLVKRRPRRKYIFSRQGKRRRHNDVTGTVAQSSGSHSLDIANDLNKEGQHCDVNRRTDNEIEIGSDLSRWLREIRSEKKVPNKGLEANNSRRHNDATKPNCNSIFLQQGDKIDNTDHNDFKQYEPTHTARGSLQDNDISQTSGYCSVSNELIREYSSKDFDKESKGLKKEYRSVDRESLTEDSCALDRAIKTNARFQATADEWLCLDTKDSQRTSNNTPSFKPIVAKNIEFERSAAVDGISEDWLIRKFNSFHQASPRSRPPTNERPLSRREIFDFGEEKHFEELFRNIDSVDSKTDVTSDASQERNETDNSTSSEFLGRTEDAMAASFDGNFPSMTSSLLNPVDDCDLSDSDTLGDTSSVKYGGRGGAIGSSPHSAMKKGGTGVTGSAGKRQRVKFDLDLEIHVVPRDSLHSTPVDFVQTDDEFYSNEDCEASVFKTESLSDVSYENSDLSYDLNNAFGKVSIRGTLTPFRVISRDSLPASGRSPPSFANSNFPIRRDSIDIIEMQKFLKQQARERALNSSTLSSRNNSHHDRIPKQEVLPQSASIKPPNTSPAAGRFVHNVPVNSSLQHHKFVPRYAHLQRQYEDWDDRRRRKQRLYERRPSGKHSDEASMSVDPSYVSRGGGSDDLPIIHTPYFEASDRKDTNDSLPCPAVDSNAGIRRIMSADPSVINRARPNANSHHKQSDPFSYPAMAKPFKYASNSVASTKVNGRTYRQFQYESDRRFDNSYIWNDARRRNRSFSQSNTKTLPTKQQQSKSNDKDKLFPAGNGSSFNQFNFAKLSEGARSALKDAHRSYVRNFNDIKAENVTIKNAPNRTSTASTSSRVDGLSLNSFSRSRHAADERSKTSSSTGTAVTVQSLGVTAFTPNSHAHTRKRDSFDYNVPTFRTTGRSTKPVPPERLTNRNKTRQRPLLRDNRTEDAKLLLSFRKISPKISQTCAENRMSENQPTIFSPKIIA